MGTLYTFPRRLHFDNYEWIQTFLIVDYLLLNLMIMRNEGMNI